MMTRKRNSDLTIVYNVRERTFYERVTLISIVRDYVHSKLRPTDGATVSERPFSVYRHWVQTNASDPYFKRVGFCDLIPVLSRSYIGQAFAYSLHLKPYTDADVTNCPTRYDRRPWQIFNHYRFAGSDLFVNIIRGCTGNDLPAGWVSDAGAPFETVLYMLLLGRLKFPRNRSRKRCINPSYPSFSLSTPCLNVLARAIQHVVRAWDEVAHVLHIRSTEQLTAPYLIFDREAWVYRALRPQEGFAPDIQTRSLDDVRGPTQDRRQSHVAVQSGRSTEAHAALRHLTEIFLSDLSTYVLCDQLFADLGNDWPGEQFLIPSRKTSLSVRFDECVDTLRHARTALQGENFEMSRGGARLRLSTLAYAKPPSEGNSSMVRQPRVRMPQIRMKRSTIRPSNRYLSPENGSESDDHSPILCPRAKKLRQTHDATPSIHPSIGAKKPRNAATNDTDCNDHIVHDDYNGGKSTNEGAIGEEIIVIEDEDQRTNRLQKLDYEHHVTLEHTIPAHLPAISTPPDAVIDVLARKTRRVGSLRGAHDGGPHKWSSEALDTVIHEDMEWLLAVEGHSFGVYAAPSRARPGRDGLFADRTFRPGDVVAPLHGAIAYDCGDRDAFEATVRIVIGEGNPAVDRARFDEAAVALPTVRTLWRLDDGGVIKRVFVVPSRACIGSLMVNLHSFHNDNHLPHPDTVTELSPSSNPIVNARVSVMRRRCGILKKKQLCATNAVKIVASRTIQVDDEICAKFVTGARSHPSMPSDDSGSSDEE